MTRALMFQGTGSDVGKSVLTAGLCRAAANRGLSVAPFKPQNMSNNAAVALDPDRGAHGEIGRAQWVQALAARVEPTVHMNPVLLKPSTDTRAQVVVQGRMIRESEAEAYQTEKPRLLDPVLESFTRVGKDHDLVIVEGAGSPAEVNLRDRDIANMGFATAANVPVVLIGDIDRGGVIANLVGTFELLDSRDRSMIAGFIINKFRGDVRLFDSGLSAIADRTGWTSFGVLPWLAAARTLPAEDAVVLDQQETGAHKKIKIAAPLLSRIANFDDLDPLKFEPDVEVQFVTPGEAIPGDADCIILLGTKATITDLAFLRTQGWDIDIAAHVRRDGHVLGICGGFQMLGRTVEDPHLIESAVTSSNGLGLLDIATVMQPEKTVGPVRGQAPDSSLEIEGYEIHIGQTQGPDTARPFALVDGRAEGACDASGRVQGTYLHGVFAGEQFRRAFLQTLGAKGSNAAGYWNTVDAQLDALADHMEQHLDVDALLETAGQVS